MEENSEVQMDTDVSSTAGNVPDTQQVMGIHGNVETVIVVEEVKEEDLISYGTPETSPTKSKDLYEAVQTPTLSSEKDSSKNKVTSPNKEVQIVYLNKPRTPTKPVEVNCTITESKQDEKTPPKSEHVQKSPRKLEQVQRPPIKLVLVQKSHNKFSYIQQETPKKSDHVEKIQNQSDLVQKTTAISEPMPKTHPESEHLQKTSLMTEQVPKNLDQAEKLHTNSDCNNKSDQINNTPPKSYQMPKIPTLSEQIETTSSEHVHEKLDQVLKIPTNSDQMHKTPTKELQTEKVQKAILIPDIHNKVDQVQKIQKISPIKSLEQQKSKDTVDITDNEVASKPLEVADLEKSTKELKQSKESLKEQSKETPGKLNLVNKSDPQINKSDKSSIKEKSPIKESLDNHNSNMDYSENKEQTKESSDKVKGNKKDKKKEDVSNISMDICEKSNDSQLETNTDVSEKDHNKSISRELKSLIKSAKESKIISECTQLTSKTRKSRAAADSTNTSLNASVEADKIQSVRRSSISSQKSNCSEKSEKTSLKRSMRSQNPDFVNKVKQFLNSVTGRSHKVEDEEEIDSRKKENYSGSLSPSPKKKKLNESQQPEVSDEQNRRLRSDQYCWRCHWAVEQTVNEKGHPPLLCSVCPRSFHYKCLSGTERNKTMTVKGWICPECMIVLHAESAETQSLAMKKLNHPRLCELLQYAWDRLVNLNGVDPFLNPVDRTAFPDYDKYVIHPMDLSLMKTNISKGNYGSTEAFLADAQWILHNSIIFNTLQSKLTGGARALVRSCRAEMGEIEACPECYAAAHTRRLTWFTDVCSTPHILLWAKLKGFPYWPAKGMSVNCHGLVDVRFFGAHDRAWVPARDCFLYCQKDPNNFKAKRLDILESMQEAEDHIRNISRKYGKFVYPAFKTPFDPSKLTEQLKMMIPAFDGELSALVKEKPATSSPRAVKIKSRSNSKSSRNSVHEGYVSESEEAKATHPRKMVDGDEIAHEIDEVSIDKNAPMEIEDQSVHNKESTRKRRQSALEEAVIRNAPMEIDDQSVHNKEKESTRKRRKSALEEAVITIITTSSNEKKKKVDNEKVKDSKKAENTQETSEKTKETLPINAKNERTAEKEKNKVNKKGVPTPTFSKKGDVDIPTNKVEKVQVVTSTPVKTTPKMKPIKTSTPKVKEEKTITPKQKPVKPDKPQIEKEKQDQAEKEKQEKRESITSRRRSKSRNRSLLNSSQGEKGEKTPEKKSETDSVSNHIIKDKVMDKESDISSKDKESVSEKPTEKAHKTNTDTTDSSKSVKDRLQFDDDTSLAVIARETAKKILTGLPTISSVRSLSTIPQTTSTTTKTTATAKPKTVEITVPADCALNVFTPTSTENVRNMKEAVDKLQKLRNETDKPLVGRLGVRSFARMTSPPAPLEKEKSNEIVEVEVKSEPIDFDDADRQVEKMDLMKAFQLRPVNPVTVASLRDVRINKLVVAPAAKKAVTKPTEVRIRARKTFPTPRKDTNDGRSELNGKNSMVYIPIQPPTTQAPIPRPTRPITINGGVNTQTVRPQAPNSIAHSLVNTQTTPLVSVPMTTSLAIATPKPTNTIATSSHSNAICVPSVGHLSQIPTVGQIPTTVHTVPLITSVNGQWTFSLQPMMSVGGDGTDSSPVVNGLSERGAPFMSAPPNQLAVRPSTQLQPNNNNITSNNSESTQVVLPRLQQRPPLVNPFDPSAPSTTVPIPSTAGPLTAKLSQNAVKLADFFRTLLEDSLEKLDDPLSQATMLKAQLEQVKWRHQQELNELKHTHELLTTEMRVGFEKEKARALSEMRRVAQVELEAAVKAAKTKQWCANCSQEAQFYCCWNTSYCDYSCQRSHWSQHFAVCTQQRNTDNNPNENGTSLDKRLQPAPENLPRTAAAPPLAVGTKLTPTRVYAQEPHPQKTSIIVSMVEDPSGNQMVKCVGTYKPPGTQQVSPLILNKQLINDDNATKKVMTSGGYLIVGAGNNAPLATNRRTHPVQYTYNT